MFLIDLQAHKGVFSIKQEMISGYLKKLYGKNKGARVSFTASGSLSVFINLFSIFT